LHRRTPTATIRHIMYDPVLDRFVSAVTAHPEPLLKLRLFGSRARGDALPESDYDILVLTREHTPALTDRLYDAVLDVLFDTGRLVSLKVYPEVQYRRSQRANSPFPRNVEREGVELWTAPIESGSAP